MGHKYPKPKDVGIGQITEPMSFIEIGKQGKTYDLTESSKRVFPEEKEIKGVALLKNCKVVIALAKVTEDLKVLIDLNLYDCKPINIKKKEIEIDLMVDIDGEKVESLITSIIGLSSGNFIVVAGQLYEFDPENLDNGPIRVIPIPKNLLCIEKYITPKIKDLCEICPGKLICSFGGMENFNGQFVFNDNSKMLLFDLDELDKGPITIFSLNTITFSRLFPSKINEDYIYTNTLNASLFTKMKSGADLTKDLSVIKNIMMGNQNFMEIPAIVQIWKKEDFLSGSLSNKNPKASVKISDTHPIFDVCDYDKGRILVDNCTGTYIVDIEEQKILAKFVYGNKIKEWVKDYGGTITVLKNGYVVRVLNKVAAGIDLFNEKIEPFSTSIHGHYRIFLDGKYLLLGTNESFTLFQFFP